MSWVLGNVLDHVVGIVDPANPALIHGDRVLTWADLNRRSNNLARNMLAGGAEAHDKVAFYMRNRPEYTETFAACLRASQRVSR
jgi:fatty-acyl-CoA synthase